MALDDDEEDTQHAYPHDFSTKFYADGKTEKSEILLKTENFVQGLDKVPSKTVEVAVMPAINKVTMRTGKRIACTYPTPSATVLY
jgi:hypothetical protein